MLSYGMLAQIELTATLLFPVPGLCFSIFVSMNEAVFAQLRGSLILIFLHSGEDS